VPSNPAEPQYVQDRFPDGERFLVGIADRSESQATITVLLNWLSGPG